FSLPRLDSVRFLTDVPLPPNLSDLNRPALEALLVKVFGEVAALKQTVSEQREEIARLKGLKGRPPIKPSGMDKATEPPKPAKKGKRRFRGKVTPRVSIEDQVVKVAVPEGSRFKGYEPFLVQDLVISARATCYQRERWVTPDGRTILAPLPERTNGSFRPGTAPLRADAVPSGAVHAAPAGRLAALGEGGDLETPAATFADGQTRKLRRRSAGCFAC